MAVHVARSRPISRRVYAWRAVAKAAQQRRTIYAEMQIIYEDPGLREYMLNNIRAYDECDGAATFATKVCVSGVCFD